MSCLSCLPVTLVYHGQTVRLIKMKLGIEVGLDPGHIALHGVPAPPQKGAQPPIFPHVCCAQTAGSIKMPFRTDV